MTAPIEVTTKYATTVNTLPEAWAFVMNHIDRVGPDPHIRISPVWLTDPREFEVTVHGMTVKPPGPETRDVTSET